MGPESDELMTGDLPGVCSYETLLTLRHAACCVLTRMTSLRRRCQTRVEAGLDLMIDLIKEVITGKSARNLYEYRCLARVHPILLKYWQSVRQSLTVVVPGHSRLSLPACV